MTTTSHSHQHDHPRLRLSLRFPFTVLASIFLAILPLSTPWADSVFVAFRSGDDGGLARVVLGADGAPDAATVLFRAPSFRDAAKLCISGDGRRAVLNAETESSGEPNLALLDLQASAGTPPILVTLDFLPEEHRIWRDRAFVGGKDGHLVAIDLASGRITHRWNSRKQLTPPGHKPEDIQIMDTEELLLVSHQKDGKKGRQGSRIVILKATDLSLVADLPLPRNHPELHLSDKEAGPSPEVIRVDRASNTLLVTLDLYGALAFADLDAALAGKWQNPDYLPTGADAGQWGTAFPDRVILAPHEGRTLAFVSNASQDGGITVFDVAARRRVAFLPVEAGCDYPVLVDEGHTVATVVSGKRKRRLADSLENITTPGTDLILIDVSRAASGDSSALARVPMPGKVVRIAGLPGHPALVAIGITDPDTLVIYDTVARQTLGTVPLPGKPVNIETAR
ncbi:hypothetical protein [Geminisphaera colitermitum]|uniref:hypothetical protein n=1 Tax=Geminisphaera colitermitum TaxID=1148786 RepID=UPI000158C844|nr:hypothetical protein [Geminisphaera colitermitum]